MAETYVVTGILTDGKTVMLDEAVPVAGRRVRVTVEVVEPEAKVSFLEVMEQIRESQRRRGHVPRSVEEIEAQIREERDSWGD